jgi:hypothetical protein
MDHTGIEQLCRRWLAVAAFREATHRDLVDAARCSGVILSEGEWDLLRRAADFLVADADDAAKVGSGDSSAGGGDFPAARAGANRCLVCT